MTLLHPGPRRGSFPRPSLVPLLVLALGAAGCGASEPPAGPPASDAAGAHPPPAVTLSGAGPRLFSIRAPWSVECPPGRRLTRTRLDAIRRPAVHPALEALDPGGWVPRPGLLPAGSTLACWRHVPRGILDPEHLHRSRLKGPEGETLRRVANLHGARQGNYVVAASGVYLVRHRRQGPPGGGWTLLYPQASPAGAFVRDVHEDGTRLDTHPVTLGEETRLAVILPPPAAVVFPLVPPAGAQLEFGYGVAGLDAGNRDGTSHGGPAEEDGDLLPEGIGFRVEVRAAGEPPRRVWERMVRAGDGGRFLDATVSLGDFAGREIRLAFSSFSPRREGLVVAEDLGQRGKGQRRDGDEQHRPRDAPSEQPAYLAAPLVQPASLDPLAPPSAILIVLDTLRADALSAYGNPRPLTPHLDALARKGVLFEHARSPSSWTLPAHATLFTSLLPPAHGAREGSPGLAERFETLAEVLASQGLQTAAFTEGIWVSPRLGMGQGFDRFVTTRDGVDAVFDRAWGWIEARATPFLAFLHSYEVHGPYDPPEEERQRWVRPYEGALPAVVHPGHVLEALREGGATRGAAARDPQHEDARPEQEDARYVRDLYEAEVAHADEAVGRLVQRLRDAGLLERTLLAVTSDHGEEFLDHGGFDHHRTLYEEMLHVPLILHMKGRYEGGTRITRAVGLEDIAPTITEALGVPAPPSWRGVALDASPAPDGGPAPRDFLAMLWPRGSPRPGLAVLRGTRKWILPPPRLGAAAAAPSPGECYDLAADPGETHNLWAPGDAARLAALLEELHAVPPRHGKPLPADAPGAAEDPEDLPRLRELGYVR